MEIATSTSYVLFQAGMSFGFGMVLPMMFVWFVASLVSSPLVGIGEMLEHRFNKKV